MQKFTLFIVLLIFSEISANAQTGIVKGRITNSGSGLSSVSVMIAELNLATITDTSGFYEIKNIPYGRYGLHLSSIGFETYKRDITVNSVKPVIANMTLTATAGMLNDVVVTGTLKAVSRAASPIPVEVYTPKYFQKNPTPSLFEAVGLINGVRPQLNCNVCNTGDIHINGMEGPYTLVLIDGMPIVSALSAVYGLSGIPNSMVERIEVVKGPAASLYGSEAMGGIINVITKNPARAPAVSVDVFGTTWQEYNTDVAVKFKLGKAQSLLGANYYNYTNRLDKNKDGFTDVTLQNRISLFNKWSLQRKDNRVASLGLRYIYEDRFGGQMNWNKQWRGSDSIYGESIYTSRVELFGLYQLPVKEKIMLQYSYNRHDQNSFYGKNSYQAIQKVAFAQLYWDRSFGTKNDFLLGLSYRSTFYDDNTPATAGEDSINPKNRPMHTPLPGVFVQDKWTINEKNTLLIGYRYDYDKIHGNIHSPRVAYKWTADKNNIIRASFGTGFRVVNLFTEDHAALTGARQVIIKEALKPEKSFNSNLNYVMKIPAQNFFAGLDITGFYSYFTNKITGDYDSDPDKIIYDNLKGHSISRGISVNADVTFRVPLKILAGVTYLDVYQIEKDGAGKVNKSRQVFAPQWSGNYLINYTFSKQVTVDFTGNFNGTMRLPIQLQDYRPGYSPLFTIANIQVTKKFTNGIELYGGLKNIFSFFPAYSLMRPFDPFDKTVNDPIANPYHYTFDTEYNYAPIQGIRGFFGARYNLFKQ